MGTFIVSTPDKHGMGGEVDAETVHHWIAGKFPDEEKVTVGYAGDWEAEVDATLADMAAEVKEVNVANGWYEDDRSFGDEIALLHSEVSEALEEYREHHDTFTRFKLVRPDSTEYVLAAGSLSIELGGTLAKPVGVGSEAADILIRLLDFTDRHGIDLGLEYRRKLAYNRTRGYKHGGKVM